MIFYICYFFKYLRLRSSFWEISDLVKADQGIYSSCDLIGNNYIVSYTTIVLHLPEGKPSFCG